jgi:thioredoxin-like negative regulator of GroEL
MRLLDKLPVFGTVRRARGWMRRNRLWIYLGLIVLLIYIVRPVLIMLAGLFDILKGPIRALLDNPVGSFIFYNLLAILLLYLVWRRVRSWVYRMFGLRAMRAFLDGMNAMILSNWGGAIPHFQKVYRIARWIRLEDAVPEHRDIAVDTSLKIAACNLRLGNANEAKSWLLRVRDKDILTDHVRRNHAELRALADDINDELEAGGDLARTHTVAKKLVATTEGPDREEAESHLALLEFRLAHKAVGEGNQREMRRALKARAGDVRAALLLGDQALKEGDLRGALKAWSRAVSLPVFDRIADLLESGKLKGDKERDMLLQFFPYAGTMIVLAEHQRRKGDFASARRAIEKVLETGAEDLTVLRLYAACLQGEGDSARAAELYRRALSSLFG